MLVRAARQQSRHRLSRHVASSFEQLHLPWLCPSVASHVERSRQLTTNSPPASRPLARRSRSSQDALTHQRRSATAAADASHTISSYDNYIPFAAVGETTRIPSLVEPWQYGSDPIRDPIRPHSDGNARIRFSVTPGSYISGDMSEKMQHFYACIRANRLDRAATLIQDLSLVLTPDHPELVNVQEQYLACMLDNFLAAPTHQRFVAMQKRFELDIRGRGTPLTGSMVSSLIKASLEILQGSQRDRAVRRYLAHAQETGPAVVQDALDSLALDEDDLAQVLSLAPLDFRLPDEHMFAAPAVETREHVETPLEPNLVFPDATQRQTPAVDSSIAHVRAVEQKGLGLSAVRQALASLSDPKPHPGSSTETNANAILAQERLEQDVVAAALEKWRSENQQTQENRTRGALTGPRLGSHIHGWIEKMKALIEADLGEVAKIDDVIPTVPPKLKDLFWVAPHLMQITPEQIAGASVVAYFDTLIDASRKRRVSEDPMAIPSRMLCNTIGKLIGDEIKAKVALGNMKKLPRNIPAQERRRRLQALMRRQPELEPLVSIDDQANTTSHVVEEGARTVNQVNILDETNLKVGAVVLEWLMKVATLPHTTTDPVTGRRSTETVTVLTSGLTWQKGRLLGVVRSHEAMTSRMGSEPNQHFLSKDLPMLVAPRPWTSVREGGYLTAAKQFLRSTSEAPLQMDYVKIADQRGDLKNVLKSLNILGKVPWRVNAPVLQAMIDVWNTGEAVAGLAPEDPIEDIPPEPDREDKVAHRRWCNIVKQARNEIGGLHSQRCYQNVQFEVARAYLDKDFYCPHSVDFRGRAYPIPPYFNHMGPDYTRALFTFAEGKPLGEEGLRWLKIHLANVYGFDKESLKDREQFAMRHLDDIYDSVNNPVKGKRWWMSAGDPWQCLAACIELKNALDAPVPAQYLSHLPIQQDGSCNGLQHYAALGGDESGARQVNLVPGDKPADIYSAVADLVRTYVGRDAEAGVQEAQLMVGRVTRKVVKQPVMTNVYGVTFVGAAAQVRKQLVDILPKETLDNNVDISRVSQYVAHLIFKALGEMFNGAQAIQFWLGECATRVSTILSKQQIQDLRNSSVTINPPATKRAATIRPGEKKARLKNHAELHGYHQFRSSVVWTTPLGLPVVQPYHKSARRVINTNLHAFAVDLPTVFDPIDKRKQLQGFPPNFIHSLDATHMMLSAIKCDEAGLRFAAVHDSFWTHASDVPTMNRVLREAFVKMHSDNVVERLREELLARYDGSLQWASLDQRSRVGRELRKWYKENGYRGLHCTRTTIAHDKQISLLLLEADRQELLNSEDPEQQAKGREMVTPASIIEAHGGYNAAIASQAANVTELELSKGGGHADEILHPSDLSGIEHGLDLEYVTDSAHTNASSEAPGSSTTSTDVIASSPAPQPAKPAAKPKSSKIYFWIPFTLSPTPKRGTFDVSRVKDSPYFFS